MRLDAETTETGYRLREASATRTVTKAKPARARRTRTREPILCRRCEEELSDTSAVFAMTPAGPSGVFLNPHGIMHEVLTVRTAKNLFVTGAPTTEFTWFPGYAWEIAWCARCRSHVGWSFTATGDAEPRAFWAFRRDSVVAPKG